MPDQPKIAATPNPIEQLRAAVDRHSAVINAAKQTGAELRTESTPPPPEATIPA